MADRDNVLDVAVVGGGPAGISACLELARSPGLRTALFESESELGGVPRSCHWIFGLRDRKRLYSGRGYARKLDQLIRRTPVEIHTQSTVLNLVPDTEGSRHRLEVVSPEGFRSFESRVLLLATGCFEISRAARLIAGPRPAGIYTTGTIQQMVNLNHQRPGRRALIIGSEHVSFSSVLTLKRAGVTIGGIVEEKANVQTYRTIANALSYLYGFRIYRDTQVSKILGYKRVEGVELTDERRPDGFRVDCDTVVITGKFRPDSALIDNTPIERDEMTLGPFVDMNFETSTPNIFAAGNILRGAEMHDLCALEGRLAARSILKRIKGREKSEERVSIRAESPIRFVVPQLAAPRRIRTPRHPWLSPGFAVQLEHTMIKPSLEAWSGDRRIWSHTFSRVIGSSRLPIPIEKFDWNRIDREKGVVLRVGP